MAASTALVATAGALAAVDNIMGTPDPQVLLRVAVGTVGAALVSAGLDKAVPGLGTGAAVLLLLAVVLDAAPRISRAIQPTTRRTLQEF